LASAKEPLKEPRVKVTPKEPLQQDKITLILKKGAQIPSFEPWILRDKVNEKVGSKVIATVELSLA
jgi:hypothetical protein